MTPSDAQSDPIMITISCKKIPSLSKLNHHLLLFVPQLAVKLIMELFDYHEFSFEYISPLSIHSALEGTNQFLACSLPILSMFSFSSALSFFILSVI